MEKIIDLTQGQVTLVDEADYEDLMRFKWCAIWVARPGAEKKWYARSNGVYMHRLLMGHPEDSVDHRDGNGLNNCRSNLRIGGRSGNARNRKPGRTKSGYIGVWFEPSTGKWRSEITVDYRRIKGGGYASAEEAARGRDKAAKLYHGEFAVLNFP